ncbi:hypothetical protein PSAC2689_10527 [Paraburkholderia sacchari]
MMFTFAWGCVELHVWLLHRETRQLRPAFERTRMPVPAKVVLILVARR